MKKTLLMKILFIISFLLILGCVHNTPPTLSGIEESYEVYGYQTLNIRAKAKDEEGDPLTITWMQTAGKPLWKKAPTGFEINLKMPADIGEDQTFKLTATVSDGKDETSFSTTITLPAYQAEVVEDMGDVECSEQVSGGFCPEYPPNTDIVLDIPSIDRYGVFDSSRFDKFEIKMPSVTGAILDLNRFLEIHLDVLSESELVTNMFSVDEMNQVLYVKENRMDEFISLLKISDEDRYDSSIELSISGYDSFGHDVSRIITFKYGYGTIKGRLVDQSGKPYAGLEGETVFIKAASRGANRGFGKGGYSAVIQIDGTFEITNLPVGVYDVLLETSDGKSAFGVPVNINLSTPSAEVVLEVLDMNASMDLPASLGNVAKNQNQKQLVLPAELTGAPEVLKKHNEYLDFLSVNKLQNNNVNGINLPLIGTLSAESAAKGSWVSAMETFIIPKEVSKIKVVYTLTSSETDVFIYRNRRGYRYRAHDRWQVKATLSNGNYSGWWGHGQVGQYWSEGAILSERTSWVNHAAEGVDTTITLAAKSINVEDSLLPTAIRVDIYIAQEELSIEQFNLKEGLGTSENRDAWYIGLASNSHKKWKASLEYSPVKMVLDSAECHLVGPGYEVPINVNIEEKEAGKTELEMGFSGVTVPNIATSPNNKNTKIGWIDCRFTAMNTETGVVAIMPREKRMFGLEDKNDLRLTPLAHYTSGFRYPFRDSGGDAWMRWEMRQYMAKNPQFIYNDASREHGGCFVKDTLYSSYNTVDLYKKDGCSLAVRDHNSHREGLSVDIRYPGAKANSHTNNLRNKLREAATNSARAEEVKNWVLTARSGIDQITSDPEVDKVYVAKVEWLKNLLNTGKDEADNLVSGLSTWDTKSKKIKYFKLHNNHMHIELKARQPVAAVVDDGTVIQD